jgi:hypothetical protein
MNGGTMAEIIPFDPVLAFRRRMARLADHILALEEQVENMAPELRPAVLEKIDAVSRDLAQLAEDVRHQAGGD